MTRAEKRKRRLVWSKVAPINGPDFVTYRYGRYVPIGRCPNHPDHYVVFDRKVGRELDRGELMRVPDAALMHERYGLN